MVIKMFSDGSYLEYSEGNFDQWCVYMVNPAKHLRFPPLDTDYFRFLQNQSQTYGKQKIYEDFISLYNLTQKQIQPSVLGHIEYIAQYYGELQLEFEKIFTILYMAMIAEENKARTKLGKRIKRLGIHRLLIENDTAQSAANFMRGMNWRQIDALCKERGF